MIFFKYYIYIIYKANLNYYNYSRKIYNSHLQQALQRKSIPKKQQKLQHMLQHTPVTSSWYSVFL